ncbi:MAG: DUF975 family protein [Elusimicrobia bacterium]|nr:DUF975 family protein [Elusimicrobiota bacterium]
MSDRLYLKGDAVRFGWEKVKARLLFFVLISLTVIFVNVLPQISDQLWGPSLILGIVFFLIKTFIDIGMTKVSLNFVGDIKTEYSVLFSGMPYYLRYLGTVIVFMVLTLIGFILLIIPGIIVGVRLMFFGPLVIDKGLAPIEALKRSFEITKGKFWDLLLLSLIIFGINILGILCLGVGLLVTLPLTSIAIIYVYRKLEGK